MSRSSYETNDAVVRYMKENFDSDYKIIDIGAGAGKMWDLLHDSFPNMDCIEVWTPFVDKFLTNKKYNKIFNVNCMDFNDYDKYNVAIIGDMLEHLVVEDAQKLISMIPQYCVIVVPYALTLSQKHENPHNFHEQDDLTHDLMMERYPDLRLYWSISAEDSKTTPNGLGVYVRQ